MKNPRGNMFSTRKFMNSHYKHRLETSVPGRYVSKTHTSAATSECSSPAGQKKTFSYAWLSSADRVCGWLQDEYDALSLSLSLSHVAPILRVHARENVVGLVCISA